MQLCTRLTAQRTAMQNLVRNQCGRFARLQKNRFVFRDAVSRFGAQAEAGHAIHAGRRSRSAPDLCRVRNLDSSTLVQTGWSSSDTAVQRGGHRPELSSTLERRSACISACRPAHASGASGITVPQNCMQVCTIFSPGIPRKLANLDPSASSGFSGYNIVHE